MDSSDRVNARIVKSIACKYTPTVIGATGATGATGSFSDGSLRTALLPTGPDVDLGSTGAPFRHLYVSNASIYIGESKISSDGSGNIFFTNAVGDVYPAKPETVYFSGSGESQSSLAIVFPSPIYPPPSVTANIVNGGAGFTTVPSITTTSAIVNTYDFGANLINAEVNWAVSGSNQPVPPDYVDTLAGKVGISGAQDGIGQFARFNLPEGVAYDASSSIYVADTSNNAIRKMVGATVTTVAGGVSGYNDAAGTNSQFNLPKGVCVDASGFTYVADTANNLIRMIYPDGLVTTIAGGGGIGVQSSYAEGRGPAALFEHAQGCCLDGSGNLYVADNYNHVIRKVAPNGDTTLVAGQPGVFSYIDNQYGTNATFGNVYCITSDGSGNFYVADYNNNAIRKIDASGFVTTYISIADPNSIAYNSISGEFAVSNGNSDPVRVYTNQTDYREISVVYSYSVAFDTSGNLYIADTSSNHILRVNAGSTTTHQIGTQFNGPYGVTVGRENKVYVMDGDVLYVGDTSGNFELLAGNPSTGGSDDGVGTNAGFDTDGYICNMSVDASGIVYVPDGDNSRIRKVYPDGTVTTFVGGGFSTNFGSVDGVGPYAQFNAPEGVAVENGVLYIADTLNNLIRGMDLATGVVTRVAGGGIGTQFDYAEGRGPAALFNGPYGCCLDGSGNLYVADTYNYVIRKVTPNGDTTLVAGQPGVNSYIDNQYGTNATFDSVNNITYDGSGNFYVADYSNAAIRKIDASGYVSTYITYTGPNSIIYSSIAYSSITNEFAASNPIRVYTNQTDYREISGVNSNSVAFDTSGNLYIAAYSSKHILRVNAGSTTTHQIGTQFNGPYGVTVGRENKVYVMDEYALYIGDTSGNFELFAGRPASGGSEDGVGTNAGFSTGGNPSNISVDASGIIYVPENGNNRIRKVYPDGTVTTFVGGGLDTKWGYINGATIGEALFNAPTDVAVEDGILYIADMGNNLIRAVDLSTGTVSRIAGGRIGTEPGYREGNGTNALFNEPLGCCLDGSGNLYVADNYNNVIRKVAPNGDTTLVAGQPGISGSANGQGTNATFGEVYCITSDGSGNFYVVDNSNDAIRKIDASGFVTTYISIFDPSSIAYSPISGEFAVSNWQSDPVRVYTNQTDYREISGVNSISVAFDTSGNLYIADISSNRMLRVNAGSTTTHPIGAQFSPNSPNIVTVGRENKVYVMDGDALYVGDTSGNFELLAGNPSSGSDDGVGTNAGFNTGFASNMSVDASGIVYVPDADNSRIRKVYPDGTVTTFVGGGFSISPGTGSQFSAPRGVAVEGNTLYVADLNNNRVCAIDIQTSVVTTIAGDPQGASGSLNGLGTNALFSAPASVAVRNGHVVVADKNNTIVRTIG